MSTSHQIKSVLVIIILSVGLLLTSVVNAQEIPPQPLSPSDLNWGNGKIGALRLRDLGYTGRNVKVVVIDTGIDWTHPAFTNTLITPLDWDITRRDGQGITIDPNNPTGYGIPNNPNDPMDYIDHGTAMASIIAASNVVSNIMGVAPEADICSIKVTYLVPQNPQIYTRTITSGSSETITLDLTTANATDAVDAILTWDGPANCGTLEIIAPDPAGATYYPDQSGDDFSACTNMPVRARLGQWQATIKNNTSQMCSFYLTIHRWAWYVDMAAMNNVIQYAADDLQANVINLSLAIDPKTALPAIRQAEIFHNSTVVVSAGNDRNAPLTGGTRYEITVGATDETDTLANFSALGPAFDGNVKPDVVAPGADIVAPISQYSFGEIPRSTRLVSGTSAAAAHVSGAAAQLIYYFRYFRGYKALPSEIKALLIDSAVNVGITAPPANPNELKPYKDNAVGAGRIDLYRAINTFLVSGEANNEERIDVVRSYAPLNAPGFPVTPLKGTLYWSLLTPYDGFELTSGGTVFVYSDTAMSTYYPPPASVPYAFTVEMMEAFETDPWDLALTYPPIRQTVDGVSFGYYYTETLVPVNIHEYKIIVPDVDLNGLRIFTYQSNYTDQITLSLFDPTNTVTPVGEFTLYGMDVKQIVMLNAVIPGEWTLRTINTSGVEIPMTIFSNHPFDFTFPHHVYMPGINNDVPARQR